MMVFSLRFLALFASLVRAQYPPRSDLTTIKSPVDGNITISYKSPPAGTCKTAFETQQQYTGWVNIPGDYPTNTFFWFVEAREPTQHLTIWLNGGPGTSSMLGMFTEVGPCEVIQDAEGVFGTKAREWGWDRASNMLFIDQPNQVGFSYDTPTNCSLDMLTQRLYTPPQEMPSNQPDYTFLNGTFSSLDSGNTANTTDTSAMAIWHMLQGFLSVFPQYSPPVTNGSASVMGVNLFAESYGGKYAPAFARLWQEQNEKRLNGSIPRSGSLAIKLASVGIINGCVDDLIQGPYYPYMAVNNSYGLTAINPTRAELAKSYFYGEHGCQEAIINCRTAQQQLDPNNVGNNNKVNNLCALAYTTCSQSVMGAYDESNRSPYDIAHMLPDSFPPSTYLEYLNTVGFQEAIGSPINYTESNFQVLSEFVSTGDHEREDLIPEFAALLNAGVRIGFIYGDRDYICNWYGGEAISLAVAKYQDTSPAYNSIFPASGYAPIVVNASEYVGGVVRQFGNLSFSRIYDAGHLVPAYQPETAFQVFARIINGNSVSTGEAVDLRTFNTTGPLVSDHKNKLPDSPPTTCWVRNIPGTCTDEEKMLIVNGTGLIVGGVLYLDPRRYTSMVIDHTTTVSASSPTAVGSVTTVTEVLTGMYTATGVPEGGSSHLRAPFMLGVVVSGLLSLVALW